MKTTNPIFHIAAGPHLRDKETVRAMMLSVVAALVPAFVAAMHFFGARTLVLTATCIVSCLGCEFLIVKFLFKKPTTIGDCSALVTGILLAFVLPPDLPWFMAVAGSAFAIGVAKMAFGGLGNNFVNPALAARAFLAACYPATMTAFRAPLHGTLNGLSTAIDGVSAATPLASYKHAVAIHVFQALEFQDALPNLFFGNVGGCLGATSAVALLAGALFLWYRRVIGFRIPVTFVGTVFLLFWIFNGTGSYFTSDALIVPLFHVLAGGLLLGALFMATDPATSPVTPRGRMVFGAGCGVLTFLIRTFGGYPDGVAYSILLMNLVNPLIDRWTRPGAFGKARKRA